ncbi:MAG TPA: adenylate/guanylate cyclase domain-containing protein [Vicinamibacteria bacterium]|nr:adenylate/guanylate cyclase domain-containing protein [Vicinamibacteria bacterium]
MAYLRGAGSRTRRLAAFLARRARTAGAERAELDRRRSRTLFRQRAIVFTDTDDFTVLVARHGVLHFLMLFDRAVHALEPVVRRGGGRLLKAEGDSLLLSYPDAAAACRGVVAMQATLRRLNARKPRSERLAFSYGIGFGDVLEIEHDVFGLEVNLASKLGEDRARRNEALLTPAAAAALPSAVRGRLVPHAVATFEGRTIPVQRLRLG